MRLETLREHLGLVLHQWGRTLRRWWRVRPDRPPACTVLAQPPALAPAAAPAADCESPGRAGLPEDSPDPVIDRLLTAQARDMPALLQGLRDHLARPGIADDPAALVRVIDTVARDAGAFREAATLLAFSGLVEFLLEEGELAPVPRLALLQAIARCQPPLAWSLTFELCAQLGGESMAPATRGGLLAFLLDPANGMPTETRAHMLDAIAKRAPLAIEDTPAA